MNTWESFSYGLLKEDFGDCILNERQESSHDFCFTLKL